MLHIIHAVSYFSSYNSVYFQSINKTIMAIHLYKIMQKKGKKNKNHYHLEEYYIFETNRQTKWKFLTPTTAAENNERRDNKSFPQPTTLTKSFSLVTAFDIFHIELEN